MAATIFVAAHDGGCEGHSIPVIAFADRETAFRWLASQSDSYSIAEVPVFPNLPTKPWYMLEAEK